MSVMERERRLSKRQQDTLTRMDKEALHAVLATRQGRWFLMRLFDVCRVFERTFTGNSQTFFLEGMREVGNNVRSRIIQDGEIDLLQLAEREYVEQTQQLQQLKEADGNERRNDYGQR